MGVVGKLRPRCSEPSLSSVIVSTTGSPGIPVAETETDRSVLGLWASTIVDKPKVRAIIGMSMANIIFFLNSLVLLLSSLNYLLGIM